MAYDTIPKRLFDRAESIPAAPAYYVKQGGVWVPTGYRLYADHVKRAGKALMALGCKPGSSVCILGTNRPEWIIMDLACMSIGGAPAGIYATSTSPEVRYIINHTEAPVVLVENEAQYEKIRKERANLPNLRWIVTMQDTSIRERDVLTWEEFLFKGELVSDAAFFERLHALEPKGLATLIYTSGTTGPPKGVMLSHENLAFSGDTSIGIAGSSSADRGLSYLPLSHIVEQICSIYAPITAGGAIHFAESLEKLPENIKEIHPTLFFGVPRIWEKFHAGIAAKLNEVTGTKKSIVDWARSVGLRVSQYKMEGKALPFPLAMQYRIADKLVFRKLKEAIGLECGRYFVSGAAPISKDVLDFFASIDMIISEGYGQSENSGGATINRPGSVRLGSVGRALPGIEIRIADDGEILTRGPDVFLGYYKEPTATAATLIDGWLHSGDLGAIDKDGFVSITGRKKEIIITAGGKNITPANIEHGLKSNPLVGEAVVIGDRRKHLTALVTLDAEAVARFRRDNGIAGDGPFHALPEIVASVQRTLDTVNDDLARVEQVKKFVILPAPFSVETGELTPTLKVKRKIVEQKFKAEIDSMYAEE